MKKLILNSICILGIVLLCSCSNTSVSVAPRSEKTPHATEEKSKSHETKTENVNTDKMQGVYLRSCKPVWQYSQVYDGDYYYFSGSGEMQTGWQFISNNWYYLAKDTGIMYSSGWHADPETKTMYYFYTWGGAARNTTLTLNGYRVKFLSWGGISGSTWLYHDGAWYYVQKYSCVTNGWYQIDGAWYFMNADGSLKQNESFLYDNNLYFVNKSGKMYQNQWLKWDGNYYYLRSWGGAAHEGWLLLQNKYYYINEDCTRKTDEAFTYDNNLYFVDENGVMPANQWVIREGVWYFTYSWGGARKSQWFYYKNNWYYFNDDASMQTGWAEIDGKTYYFQSWGGCVTGTKKIDGTTYVFDKNGVLLSEKES